MTASGVTDVTHSRCVSRHVTLLSYAKSVTQGTCHALSRMSRYWGNGDAKRQTRYEHAATIQCHALSRWLKAAFSAWFHQQQRDISKCPAFAICRWCL
jgi:hypothetical protein